MSRHEILALMISHIIYQSRLGFLFTAYLHVENFGVFYFIELLSNPEINFHLV